MTTQAKIAEIINKRQTLAHKTRDIIENWKLVKSTLQAVNTYRERFNIGSTNFDTNFTEIDAEIDILTNLVTRLSRDTLNIGMVGRMGQGKSRLLQSLTGLTDDVIPTGAIGVCTSALTKIFHEPGSIKAHVDFYTWDLFRDEVIDLYYKHLGLGRRPDTPGDFKTVPPLPEDKRNLDFQYLYGHFRKEYVNDFNKFQSYLNGSTKTLTTINEIRSHITQDNRDINGNRLSWDDIPIKEARIFCEFIHKEVEKIGFVDLPGLGDNSILDVELLVKALKQDVDFILFVRMPHSKVYRGWDETDRKMFQIAKEALADFSPSKCSFMVINKFKGNNSTENDTISDFSERFQRELGNHFQVAKCVIADCNDPSNVRNNILIPVLEYLTDNIDSLYSQYWSSCTKRLIQLQREIAGKLEKVRNEPIVLSQYQYEFDTWFDKELWPSLTNGLQDKLMQLWSDREKADPEFTEAVERVLSNCRGEEVIPSIYNINARRGEEDSFKIAYYMYIKEIREQLSHIFKLLGEVLQKRIEDVLSSVADVLGTKGYLQELTSQKGSKFFNEILQQIPDNKLLPKLKQGFADMQKLEDTDYEDIINNWIRLHLEKLRPDDNIDPISQFQILKSYDTTKITILQKSEQSEEKSEFNVSPDFITNVTNFLLKLLGISIPRNVIESIVQFFKQSTELYNNNPEFINRVKEVISPQLDIDVDVQTIETIVNFFAEQFSETEKQENPVLISSSSLPLDISLYGTSIQNALVSLRNQVVDECEKTLKNHLNEPNQLAYTIVRKFVDSVIAAKDVQTQWRIFLRDKEATVWPKSKDKEQATQIQQEWKTLVNKAIEVNELEKNYI
jgi:hypothetical protein